MQSTDTALKHSRRIQDGYRYGVRRIRQNGHPGAIVGRHLNQRGANIDARKRAAFDKMHGYEVVDLITNKPVV
jgi:hypothetical protein